MLDHYSISLAGKNVLIIGRSVNVSKPTALALLNRDSTVTIAHSKTLNLKGLAKSANILVVAIGKAHFIDNEYIHPKQVVIDIGMNYRPNPLDARKGSFVGDADYEKVGHAVAAISPVPGGCGAMTVVSLFENLIKACMPYVLPSAEL